MKRNSSLVAVCASHVDAAAAVKVRTVLLIAHGSLEDTTRAQVILTGTRPETVEHHP